MITIKHCQTAQHQTKTQSWWIHQLLAVIFTALLISGCGFRLQPTNQLPSQLHVLYLESPQPYHPFTQQLTNTLKQLNVTLACNAKQAPFTLEILSIKQNSELISTTASSISTRPYLLQSYLTYSLKAANGDIIIAPTTITASRHFILPGNVLLDNSDEKTIAEQEMQRVLIELLLDRLASNQVKTKLATTSIQQHDTASTMVNAHENQRTTT